MSVSRILLIAQMEGTRFLRSGKAVLLIPVMLGLILLQVLGVKALVPPPVFDFDSVLYASYNGFVQFLPLALATVLAGSVCGEKENRVWYFYLSKPFREWEIILGKVLFYDLVIGAATLFSWWVTVGVTWQMTMAGSTWSAVPWSGPVHVAIIVLGVTLMVVNLEMMISSFVRKTAVAALLIVMVWILLMAVTAALPEWGKNWMAPYAAYSVQTKTVMQLLDMVPKLGVCPSCPPAISPSTFDVLIVSLWATFEAGVLALAAMVFAKSDKSERLASVWRAAFTKGDRGTLDKIPTPTSDEPEVVVVDGLSYAYGPRVALRGMSFRVGQGDFVCLLGPNGAGKSTMVKILTGRLAYKTGNAAVLGHTIKGNSSLIRRHVGILTDDMAIPDDLTVEELLMFVGRSFGLSKTESRTNLQEIVAEAGLAAERGTRIQKLSSGLRRRVEIAQALVNKGRILFLDEPTINLDPVSSREIRSVIKTIHSRGVTTIYTTHLLDEVEGLCTDLIIIDKGKIKLHGSLDSLRQEGVGYMHIEVRNRGDVYAAQGLLETHGMHARVDGSYLVIPSREKKAMEAVLDLLNVHSIKIASAVLRSQALADIYAQAVAEKESYLNREPEAAGT